MLRIWPLYCGYLLVSLVLLYIFGLYDVPNNYFYYILLIGNVAYALHIAAVPLLSHLWSIGVEEQFYLFWPWLVRSVKHEVIAFCVFLAAFIVIKLVFRYLVFRLGNAMAVEYAMMCLTRFDCMAIGAIGAYGYFHRPSKLVQIMSRPAVQLLAWLCLGLVAVNRFYISDFVNHDLLAAVTLCVIIGVIEGSSPISLDNQLCEFLGRISFGIYVLHPLIRLPYFRLAMEFGADGVPLVLVSYPLVILLTVLLAYLSYEHFEKRFLQMKRRFAVVESAA